MFMSLYKLYAMCILLHISRDVMVFKPKLQFSAKTDMRQYFLVRGTQFYI